MDGFGFIVLSNVAAATSIKKIRNITIFREKPRLP